MLTRRDVLKTAALAAAAGTFAPLGSSPAFAQTAAPAAAGPFTLPTLPYAFDALEPHLDARTMEIHHGKHHATYVAKLNEAVAKEASLANWSLEDLVRKLDQVPESVRTAVRNHGGGHLNHSWFWQMMSPKPSQPTGELAKAIDKQWGSFDQFWEKMAGAATGVFGSGWAWVTLGAGNALQIETTPNQDNPLSQGRAALLGIDVWEHAYYLKFQNKRVDYVAAWRQVVNWDFVSARYVALTTGKA